jgi:hypothetical protein
VRWDGERQGTCASEKIPVKLPRLGDLEKLTTSITVYPSIAAMYQRNVCPTVGALRRTLAADVAAAPRSSARAFSVSARRFDEPKDAAPAAPGMLLAQLSPSEPLLTSV